MDILHEQLLRLLFPAPQAIPTVAAALRKGRTALKAYLAGQAPLDPNLLPYHDDFPKFFRAQKAQGTRVVLYTAAAKAVAQQIREHVELGKRTRR